MKRIGAQEARKEFSTVLNQVAFGGERVVVHRHGKDLACLVSISDARLLEEIEDRMDLEAAREALKEKGKSISLSKLKKELGL